MTGQRIGGLLLVAGSAGFGIVVLYALSGAAVAIGPIAAIGLLAGAIAVALGWAGLGFLIFRDAADRQVPLDRA